MTRYAVLFLILLASPAWAVPFCGGDLQVKDRWRLQTNGTDGKMTAEQVKTPCDDVISVLYADDPVTVPAGTALTFVYNDREWRVPSIDILYPYDRAESQVRRASDGFTTDGPRTARSGGWILILRFPAGTINTLKDWEPDAIDVEFYDSTSSTWRSQ